MSEFYTHPVFSGIDTKDNWIDFFEGFGEKKEDFSLMLIPFDIVNELKNGLPIWKDCRGQYQYGYHWRKELGIDCNESVAVGNAIAYALIKSAG